KNQAMPRVTSASGNVRSLRIGLRIVFSTPNTAAASIRAKNEWWNVIPLSTKPVIPRTTALAAQETKIHLITRADPTSRAAARSRRMTCGRAPPSQEAPVEAPHAVTRAEEEARAEASRTPASGADRARPGGGRRLSLD